MSDFWIEGRKLIKYNGTGGDIVIPDMVSEIMPCAFENAEITSVKFPLGIREIGSAAFKNCGGLKELSFPAGLSYIGKFAFLGCTGIEKIKFYDGQGEANSLEIDQGAFFNCPSLELVDFPERLKSIGFKAFAYCGKMKHIYITEKCEKIGSQAFSNCTSLERAVVPKEAECASDAFSAPTQVHTY